MSRRKPKIDKKTRRVLDQVGEASGFRYVADRADIIRTAKALADELGLEDDTDIYAVLDVARFLAGDKQED